MQGQEQAHRCELRLALLILLLRLRVEDVIDGYVDFRNPQSHQVLDPLS